MELWADWVLSLIALKPHKRLYFQHGFYALSVTLLYIGISLLFSALWALLLLLPLLVIVQIGVIQREEHYLEHKFGDEYLRYKARVRRWI